MRKLQKLSKIHTDFVWINSDRCRACWRCINACPQQVIGKVGALWHRHIVIANPENCSGCKKCINACHHGVFNDLQNI